MPRVPRLLIAFALSLVFTAESRAATMLEPAAPGPTAGNISETAVAFAGGKFLTVWRQMYMPRVGIWGAFSDASGKPLTAFPIVPQTNASFISLFPSGDSFLMQWSEHYGRSYICRIDGSGRITSQVMFDPGPPSIRAAAMVDGRILAIGSLPGPAVTGLVVDQDGSILANGLDIGGPFTTASVFPARHSFLVASVGPGAAAVLTRYSIDGVRLQSWSMPGAPCSTCGTIDGAEDLDSGSVLMLVRSGSQVTTAIAAPDGSVKSLGGVTVGFPYVQQATLQHRGSRLWAIVHAGQRTEGPWQVEAWELDSEGRIAGDPTLIVPDPLALYETLVFGDGDQTLLAATTGYSDLQVRTFAFDSLKPVTPVILSMMPSIQQKSEIASNGTGYLAAWNDSAGERYTVVHWAVLDAAGQRRSAVFSGPGDLYVHSLVSNGLDYLMLVSYGGPLVARRVAADGTLLGETTIADLPPGSIGGAAAVATAAGYLVSWTVGGVVQSSVITPAGTVSPPVESARIVDVPAGLSSAFSSVALAYDGTSVLLVATRVDFCAVCSVIAAAVGTVDELLVRADGTPLTSLEVLDEGATQYQVVAASSGSEFLVATSDSTYVVHRDGTALTSSKKVEPIAAMDLIWDGSSYVAASNDGTKFVIQQLSRDGSPHGAGYHAGIVDRTSIASDRAGNLVIVTAESNGAGPLRATSYVPSDLVPQQMRRRAAPR